MRKLVGCLLVSVFFLLAPWAFAQNSDQSSSDSGVLVSPPIGQVSNQVSTNSYGDGNLTNVSNQGNPRSSGPPKHHHIDGDNDASSDIVVKAANNIIFQMTSNLKLTQDQITAVQPIIADNIAQVRNLEQSLKDGNIDGSAMNSQRQELVNDENQALGSILTSDQMKVWMEMENQPSPKNRPPSFK